MAYVRMNVSFDSDHHAHLIEWARNQDNFSASVRALIEKELDDHQLTLGRMRLMIETILDEKLAGLSLASAQPTHIEGAEDDLLSDFDDLLT